MQDFINGLNGLSILNRRTVSIALHVDTLPVTYREKVRLMVREHLLIQTIYLGFRKWKDSSNLLEKHSQSERHANAMSSRLNFNVVNSKKYSSIKEKLDANRSKEVEDNREHVKCLLRVTSLLGRQGLAFRGHDESETSENRGNFYETLDMLANTNEILRKKMETRQYTSIMTTDTFPISEENNV